MRSQRAKKAKQRAQRQARLQRRRADAATGADHPEARVASPAARIVTAPAALAPYRIPRREPDPAMPRADDTPLETTGTTERDPAEVIGYMASDGHDFLRKNGECIVAASHAQMQRTAGQVWPGTPVTIQAITFEQFYAAMEVTGEAFCFDDESYARFVATARRRGMAMGDQPNSDLHLLLP